MQIYSLISKSRDGNQCLIPALGIAGVATFTMVYNGKAIAGGAA